MLLQMWRLYKRCENFCKFRVGLVFSYLCQNVVMKLLKCTTVLLLMIGLGCKTPQRASVEDRVYISNIEGNGKIYAAVFQQRAAEYSALCQQAYNLASWQIDAALKNPHDKPLAIVSDIDETLLDN